MGDTSAPRSDQGAFDNLRIVLIGTTGTGKSATGNSLIGERVFKSAGSRQSVTKECSVAERDRFGTKLVVVDTPGIFDTSMSEEEYKIQLKEFTLLACPGVHAFLFLMKMGERAIKNEDQEAFRLIKELLGEGFLSRTIVVFTAADTLEEDGQTIDEYISMLPVECTNFISSCKGGVVAVSNNGNAAKEQAAERITDKVRYLVQQNGGRSSNYRNTLFDEENEEVNKRMENILKNNHITRTKARLMAIQEIRKLRRKKIIKMSLSVVAVATGAVACAVVGPSTVIAGTLALASKLKLWIVLRMTVTFEEHVALQRVYFRNLFKLTRFSNNGLDVRALNMRNISHHKSVETYIPPYIRSFIPSFLNSRKLHSSTPLTNLDC